MAESCRKPLFVVSRVKGCILQYSQLSLSRRFSTGQRSLHFNSAETCKLMYKMNEIRQTAKLILLCAASGGITAASAQTPAPHLYTDQQLIAAGWSKAQIAAMRAQAPEPQADTVLPEADSMQPKLISYSSVFENYVSFEDTPEIGWREANDTVGRIGGWRAYTRQVQAEQKKEKMANEGAEKQ